MAVVDDLEAVEIEEQDRWPGSGIACDAQLLNPWEKRGAIDEHYAQQVSASRIGSEAGVQRLRMPWPETNPFG